VIVIMFFSGGLLEAGQKAIRWAGNKKRAG